MSWIRRRLVTNAKTRGYAIAPKTMAPIIDPTVHGHSNGHSRTPSRYQNSSSLPNPSPGGSSTGFSDLANVGSRHEIVARLRDRRGDRIHRLARGCRCDRRPFRAANLPRLRGALYQIVLEHFETFRVQAASLWDGEGLPRFVEQEFQDFLRCSCLAAGFARFRCGACGLDRPGYRLLLCPIVVVSFERSSHPPTILLLTRLL